MGPHTHAHAHARTHTHIHAHTHTRTRTHAQWQMKPDSLWNPKCYPIRTAEPNSIPFTLRLCCFQIWSQLPREHKFHLTCSQASNLATDLAGHRLIYHTLSLQRLHWRPVKPSLMAGNKSGTGSIEPRPAR